MWETLRAALRHSRRRPRLAVAAILTLGGGIGLATSVFAVVYAVLWQPLPVPNAERMVWISTAVRNTENGSSPGALLAWADRARSLAAIAGVRDAEATFDDEYGIDRLAGAFTGKDQRSSTPVVLVNETLARRLSPTGSTLVGSAVKFELPVFNQPNWLTPWEVVGLVTDTFDDGPRRPVLPEIIVPITQGPTDLLEWIDRQMLLTVRTTNDTTLLVPDLRRVAAQTSWRLSLSDVRTLETRLDEHFARERTLWQLLTWLAAAGLLLSGFGVFSIVSHLVAHRHRETALRLALGAQPAQMYRAILREGVFMTLAGLAIGLIACFPMSRFLQFALFGVTASDPANLASVAGVVVCVALAASLTPARAAARTDPAAVLRDE